MKSIVRQLLPPIVASAAGAVLRSLGAGRGPMVMHSTGGRLIRHRDTPADRGVLRQVFVDQEYRLQAFARHPDLVTACARMERPVIIDCGANIGASTVWFAEAYPQATVVAVEPEAHNFALLEANTTGLANVWPFRGAVASRPGTLDLVDPGHGEWGYRTAASGDMHSRVDKVRAYTLDELMAEVGGTPFIVKIDIEGAESDLFSQPAAMLDLAPLVIVELHDWMLPRTANSRAFLQWHVSKPRDVILRGEHLFSFLN